MNTLSIDDAVQADLDGLLHLYRHLNPDDAPCSPDEARDILARIGRYRGSGILIGKVDGAIVATCTLVVIPNLTRGGTPYALIENVVTHGEWRRHGFGAAVLAAAAERAWQSGCYKVMLMTGSTEPGTLKFYEKAGFEQSKTGFQMRRHPVRQ